MTFSLITIQRIFRALELASRDLRPMMQAIGDTVVERTRYTFISQSDPWGSPWQPLSALTIQLRRGSGAGGQILRDSGVLMNSISSIADKNSVAIGTNLIYASIQQFGGTITPKRSAFLLAGRPGGPRARLSSATIPPRPFLPIRNNGADLPQAWQTEILQVINRHYKGAVRGFIN